MTILRRTPMLTALLLGCVCSVPDACVFAQPLSDGANPQAKIDRAKIEFFEKKIRPVLVANCFECHSTEENEAGLRLDSRSGPASLSSRGGRSRDN